MIDLQNVTNVIQRNDTSRVQIIAEDAGSIVDLSRMNDLIGSALPMFIVHENAEVKWGNLTVADQVNFRLGGTLDTSTLTSVSNGSITAENGSSPAPNLNAVTNVESSSLAAGLSSVKPGVLRLPNLSTYSTSVSTTLSAVETGSLLDLSGVRTLNGPDEGFRELAVLAQLGGSVDLSGVTSINQRNSTSLVAITAQDAGSLVDLSGINDLTNSGITDITVQDGGEIRLGSLLRADGIRFFVGGVLDTANLTSVTNGSIEAEHGDLPAPNLGNVTDAESSSLRAGSAGVTGRLALPNLETYSTSVTTNLTATDAGSLLDLSAVETINGPQRIIPSPFRRRVFWRNR